MNARKGVSLRVLIAFVMVCFLWLGLGTQSAMARAEQGSFKLEQPLVTTAADPCGTGELVLLEGTTHVWGHFTLDSAGGFVTTVHVRLEDVTATGLTTGATYGYSEIQLVVLKVHADGFPFVNTQLVNFKLTGPNGPYRVQILAHITINDNGEVTAEHFDTRVNCM